MTVPHCDLSRKLLYYQLNYLFKARNKSYKHFISPGFNLLSTLKQTWKFTNCCVTWWGIVLVCLLFIAAIAMMAGFLTLEVNLDLVIINDLTNPMITLILFALVSLLVSYPIFFILTLPVSFLLTFLSKKRSQRA